MDELSELRFIDGLVGFILAEAVVIFVLWLF